MLPDRVSNPGPLTYESGALPIALRGPAEHRKSCDRKMSAQSNRKNVFQKDNATFTGLQKFFYLVFYDSGMRNWTAFR